MAGEKPPVAACHDVNFFTSILYCIGSINATDIPVVRVWIFKLLRRPEIDSTESIPPAYVAWRAGTITLALLGS